MMEQLPAYSLRLVPLYQKDAGTVLEVYRQCQDFLALVPRPEASLEMVQKDILTCDQQNGVFYGIFLLEGPLIGVISVVPRETNYQVESVCIELLLISFSYRQKGIGQQVLRLIETNARNKIGVSRFSTSVQVNNPGVVRFWQKCGYKINSGPEIQLDSPTVYQMQKDTTAQISSSGSGPGVSAA
jgi:RimJ/RimL family protein N-acetyltransferase